MTQLTTLPGTTGPPIRTKTGDSDTDVEGGGINPAIKMCRNMAQDGGNI